MKICCISDLHGNLNFNVPECDVLVIAGDICPTANHSINFQKSWLETNFNIWLSDQSAKHIIGIAGNHDFIFEHEIPKINWNYLFESSLIIDGIKFAGHPWTPEFYDWAFNVRRGDLYMKHEKIDNDTNVLITHGPPRGILDKVYSFIGTVVKDNLGDNELSTKIQNIPNLKLHAFGHLHSSHGLLEQNGITYINASLLNEEYKMVYEPIIIDL